MKTADAELTHVPTYGLYRVDDHRRSLWRVEVWRRGQAHGGEFPDHMHGGPEAAYDAALRHRDALLAQLAPTTMREWATRLRTNNTSGMSGVHRSEVQRKRRDGSVSVLAYWVATFNGVHSGRRGSRSFAVAKYGEQGAYERALRARTELLMKFVDEHEPFAPRAPDSCAALTRKAAALQIARP